MKGSTKGLAILGGVVGFVALIALLAIFGAFTISTLWAWFMVPLGVKSVGLAHAYGLSILVQVFMSTRGLATDTKNVIVQGVVLNIFALLFGYIAVSFM